ncbi:MAG: hypothetical protein HY538_06290 [Deltaproteobacteria bacterium]|nr:hypothetical protein [Deltaproteobacteria bacterium]
MLTQRVINQIFLLHWGGVVSTIFTPALLAFLISCSDGSGTFNAGTVGGAQETQAGLTLQVAGVTTEIEEATLELAAASLRQAALTSIFDPRLQQEHALKMKKAPLSVVTEDVSIRLIRGGIATDIELAKVFCDEESGMLRCTLDIPSMEFIDKDDLEVTFEPTAWGAETTDAVPFGSLLRFHTGDDPSNLKVVFDSETDWLRRTARRLLLGEGFDQSFAFVNLALIANLYFSQLSTLKVNTQLALDVGVEGIPPDPDRDAVEIQGATEALVQQSQLVQKIFSALGADVGGNLLRLLDVAYNQFLTCVYDGGLAGRAACLEALQDQITQVIDEYGSDLFSTAWKQGSEDWKTRFNEFKAEGKYPKTLDLLGQKEILGSNLLDIRIQKFNATDRLGVDGSGWTSLIDKIRETANSVVNADTMRALFEGGIFSGQINELANNALLSGLGMPITIFDGVDLSTDATCEEIEQEVGVSLGEAGCAVARQRFEWKSQIDALECDVTSTGYCDYTDAAVAEKAGMTLNGDLLVALASFSGKTMSEFVGAADADLNTLKRTKISEMSTSMPSVNLDTARSVMKSSGEGTIKDTDGDGCPDVMESAKGLNPYSKGDCDPKRDTATDADFTAMTNLGGMSTDATVPATVHCLAQSSSCATKNYNISCTGPRLVTTFMAPSKVGSGGSLGEGATVNLVPDSSAPYTCACVASGQLESACTGSATALVAGTGTAFKAVIVDPDSGIRLSDTFAGAGKSSFLNCDIAAIVGKNTTCKIFGSGTPVKVEVGSTNGKKESATFTGASELSVCIPKNLGSQSQTAVTVTFSDGSTVVSNPVKVGPEPSGNSSCYPTATASTTPTLTPTVPALSAVTASPSTMVRGVTPGTLTASPAGAFRAVPGTSTVTCTHSNGQTISILVTTITWGADTLAFTLPATFPTGSCVFNVTVGDVTKSSSSVTITAPFTISAPSSITKGQAYTITATSGNFALPDGGSRELKWTNANNLSVSSAALSNVIWGVSSLTHTILLIAQPPVGTTVTFTVTIKDSIGNTVRSTTSGNVTVN